MLLCEADRCEEGELMWKDCRCLINNLRLSCSINGVGVDSGTVLQTLSALLIYSTPHNKATASTEEV